LLLLHLKTRLYNKKDIYSESETALDRRSATTLA